MLRPETNSKSIHICLCEAPVKILPFQASNSACTKYNVHNFMQPILGRVLPDVTIFSSFDIPLVYSYLLT